LLKLLLLLLLLALAPLLLLQLLLLLLLLPPPLLLLQPSECTCCRPEALGAQLRRGVQLPPALQQPLNQRLSLRRVWRARARGHESAARAGGNRNDATPQQQQQQTRTQPHTHTCAASPGASCLPCSTSSRRSSACVTLFPLMWAPKRSTSAASCCQAPQELIALLSMAWRAVGVADARRASADCWPKARAPLLPRG
jgi:hypothetical protein